MIYIFIIVLLMLVIFACIGFSIIFLHDQLSTHAPFIGIPRPVLSAIVQALPITPGAVVYDLGCGDGRVLKVLARENPEAKFIGIEKGYIPYTMAKFNTRKFSNITIKRKDFFKESLTSANVVFAYLFPKVLDMLLPKFETELPQGAIVLLPDFQFSKKQPEKVIDLNRPVKCLGRVLRIYRF